MNTNLTQPYNVMQRIRHTTVSIFAAIVLPVLFLASDARAGSPQVYQIGTAASQFEIGANALNNFTVPAGVNRLLIVGASDSYSLDITTVTFNGTALTQIVEKNDSYAVDSLWYLVLGTAASPTNGNIVITHALGDREFISAIAFENVDQSSPVSSALSLRGNGTPVSLTVASKAGDMVLDLIDVFSWASVPTVTPTSGQTVFASQSGMLGEGFGNYKMSLQPGEATTFMSWTHNGSAFIQLGVNINLSASDTTAPIITSIVRQSPTNQVVSGSNVTFRVTFSETVTGVDASDFVVSTSGSADGSIGSLAMISGAVYDVGITNMRAAGSLRLDLRGSGTGVQDGPGNSISSGYTNGQSYLLPIVLAGPNTQWKAVRFAGTNQFDYPSDTQAGAADLDLVGNLIHPVLYTQYYDAGTAGSVSDDTIGFRARIGNPSSQTDLGSVLLVGIDGNTDGRIDLFVSADGRNNGRQVRIWSPGSAANNSPATTSITAPTNQKSYAFNVSNFVALSVSSVSDPAAGSSLNADLNADSRNDILASFNLPFVDVQSEMLRISGVTIGPDTALRYVLITLTQNNSINGDIAGINGGTSSSATYESLGLFSDTISANNTPPAISSIANQNTTTGVPTGPVAFNLSDEESDTAALTVTAMSSNLTLLPVANITLAGSGASRTVTLAPAAGQSGSAVVTLTVSDGVLATSTRFSLIVTGANSTPTDISLSSSTVDQSSGTNATVGTLATTDANSGDTFTYTLVSGAGAIDNASFNLSGATLRANNAFTMAAGAYSIRLRTTDSASAAFEETFTITVADNIAPLITSIVRKTPSLQTVAAGPVVFTVTFSENVFGVTSDRFAVTAVNGSTVIGAVTAVSGGPQIFAVTVSVTSGTGEFRLDAIDSLIF